MQPLLRLQPAQPPEGVQPQVQVVAAQLLVHGVGVLDSANDAAHLRKGGRVWVGADEAIGMEVCRSRCLPCSCTVSGSWMVRITLRICVGEGSGAQAGQVAEILFLGSDTLSVTAALLATCRTAREGPTKPPSHQEIKEDPHVRSPAPP